MSEQLSPPPENQYLAYQQNFYDQAVFKTTFPLLGDLGFEEKNLRELMSHVGTALKNKYLSVQDLDVQAQQLEALFLMDDAEEVKNFTTKWVNYYRYDVGGASNRPKSVPQRRMAEIMPTVINTVGIKPLLYLADILTKRKGVYNQDGSMRNNVQYQAESITYDAWQQQIQQRIEQRPTKAYDVSEITGEMGYAKVTTPSQGKSPEATFWNERGQVKGDNKQTG